MAATIWGIVKEGKIVPQMPLPEGLQVQITLPEETVLVPAELETELDVWSIASAEALSLVERLAEPGTGDEDR